MQERYYERSINLSTPVFVLAALENRIVISESHVNEFKQNLL